MSSTNLEIVLTFRLLCGKDGFIFRHMDTDIGLLVRQLVYRWYKNKGTRDQLERAIVRAMRLVLRRAAR